MNNLRKTRDALVEVLKANEVAIGTDEVAAGTRITLLDMKTGEKTDWNGNKI